MFDNSSKFALPKLFTVRLKLIGRMFNRIIKQEKRIRLYIILKLKYFILFLQENIIKKKLININKIYFIGCDIGIFNIKIINKIIENIYVKMRREFNIMDNLYTYQYI